jgi:hypothetical protein
MTKEKVPAVLALPEITPVELSFKPGARCDPDSRDHL